MSRPITLSRLGFQALGLVFLLVVALFVAVSVGLYNKTFTPVVPVTLETDHVGNQLRVGSDVKIRGVIIGEVRRIRASGDRAVLNLAVAPDKVAEVPRNVSALLLPKTLFGERYVALQIPDHPDRARLASGDVISQDRSATAIEVQKVLDDLLPRLQVLQPQKVASTLTEMSQALNGRGKTLGETLVNVNSYLQQINPSLEDFQADVQSLAAVSDIYNKAAPQLLQALSDLTTTSKTLVDQRNNLDKMLSTVTTASVDTNAFLQANKNNLIDLSATSEPTLAVLARYAPEYTCVLKQLADQIPKGERTLGAGQQFPHMGRLTIEFTQSRGKYVPGVDDPRYADNRGPRCYREAQPPNAFPQYPPGGPINDGSTHPPPSGGGGPLEQLGGAATTSQSTDPASTTSQSAGASGGLSVAYSPAERRLVALLVGASIGEMPQDVPEWSDLLVGPLYRGAEVTAR